MTQATHRRGLDDQLLGRAGEIAEAISEAFATRVVGQERLRTALLVSMATEGHVLLESVPGLAKTLASATLAQAVGAAFVRIQCTPDLLPSDVIGTQVYDPRTHQFDTQLGPVHANVVLLDEINRSSAKTQSAMLEAMQERQTSIAGVVHPLPRPFMVLATQNPLDDEGTYVLPRAQMDRFLLKEIVDYPTADNEMAVLDRIADGTLSRGGPPLEAVVGLSDLLTLQEATSAVHVDPSLKRYIVDLVRATREPVTLKGDRMADYVEVGASPRATIAFFDVARALAVLHGRSYATPDDVHELAHSVLRHRVHLSFEAQADRVSVESVIDAVLRTVPTP
mgnify:CR=1 FL=1